MKYREKKNVFFLHYSHVNTWRPTKYWNAVSYARHKIFVHRPFHTGRPIQNRVQRPKRVNRVTPFVIAYDNSGVQ